MASATAAATPQSRRGPLSHIVDALRLDNRELLLETIRHDPRLGDINDDVQRGGGADTAAGKLVDNDVGKNDGDRPIIEQQLIFGSDDIRRVILRQVMHHTKKETTRTKKNKHNVTSEVEEDEILKEFNIELNQSRSSGNGTISPHVTNIIGAHVLSPLGDGSLVGGSSSNQNNPASSPSRANNNMFAGQSNNNNPFEEDDNSTNSATIVTYILRGGGFDLPSLSSAALHRRHVLSKSSSSGTNRGFYSPQQQQQQQQQQPQPKQTGKVFRFLFVPRITEMERSFLRELGVEDDVTSSSTSSRTSGSNVNSLESLPIDLVPLDDDVLSLELAGGSSSLFASSTSAMNESDKSGGGMSSSTVLPPSAACLRHSAIEGCEADVADIVARSLLKLQLLNRAGEDNGGSSSANDDDSSLKGAIKRVQGLGPLATAVIDRMMLLRMEEERMEAEDEEVENNNNNDDYDYDGDHATGEGMDYDEVVNAVDGVEITANTSGMGGQQYNDNAGTTAPSIQALLVIDRKIDLVTPMLTPLTYEGLIDDVLQIQVGGCVSVKKSIVEPDDDDGRGSGDHQKVILPLNDSDPLYAEVRDKHVETFGSFLQNQAKALKESHSQFTNRETARDLTEIHQFVKQIPVFTRNLRSLTNHIHIAELVKSAAEANSFRQRWQTERSMLESEPCYETLEDLIAAGEPPYRWLRLFCLQSLTSNGIKATRYDSLRKEVVQAYGYEFLMVLNDLEKAGFLRKRETFFMDSMATPYSTLRKALNLINADVDPSNPEDAAYVTSGYAPMTVRWIQAAMQGFAGLDEAMKELPAAGGVGGRWVDVEQQWPPESLNSALKRKRGPSLGALAKQLSNESGGDRGAGLSSEKKPVLLLYFVGGVTFSELAALRFLSRKASFPWSIVCCTTEIINGSTLLRSLSA